MHDESFLQHIYLTYQLYISSNVLHLPDDLWPKYNMDPEQQDSGDVIASYKQKRKRGKRSSPLSLKTDTPSDHNANLAGAAGSNDIPDNVSNMETEDDSEAVLRSQELRAARTEEEEIERHKKLQTRTRTKAEAEHDEDLHKLRLRRIRERQAARDTERRAVQPVEAAHKSAFEMEWEAQQAASLRRRRKSRSRAPEQEEASTTRTTSTASPSGSRMSGARKERNREPLNFGHEVAPLASVSKRPSLKRTDSEAFTESRRELSPPPNTNWRDPTRLRGRLNFDHSRIDTEFILGNEYVDDVNTMLDFVNGWPEDHFADVRYAFEKDLDNRNRKVEFIDLGDKRWGVRLLNPLKKGSDTSHRLTDLYTHDDLPDVCREHSCNEMCPRKISMKEKIADLKKFREERSRATVLDNMAEASYSAGSSHGVLPGARDVPPPPIPPRSNKRTVPHGLPEPGTVPLQPHSASVSASPGSPRAENYDLSNDGAAVEYIEDMKRRNLSLDNQLKEMETLMTQIKDHLLGKQGPHATTREAVKELLQRANVMSDSCEGRSHDCAVERMSFGPIGGKLVHNEKIPAGSNSIRSEEHYLTSVFDKRSTVLELMDETARNKPREEYYAARVPPKRHLSSEGSASPLPKETKQSSSNSTDLSSSTSTQRLMFRPQYEKYPDAY